MGKMKKKNQGFSLIELLIAVTILSIVMIMVVQFMSTSSVAYRKQKKNMSVQTKAMTTMEQVADTLMQANYLRIMSIDDKLYTIEKSASGSSTVSEYGEINYQLVPDNYANYSQTSRYNGTRDVIINLDTFDIVDDEGNSYPMSYDNDYQEGVAVKSFRALNQGGTYQYIMPAWIYAEYANVNASGDPVTTHVVYYFTDVKDSKDNTRRLIVCREDVETWTDALMYNYQFLVPRAAIGQDNPEVVGIVSEDIASFYISADPEGNALLTNVTFKDDGYEYNAIETIKFRNSNVLTVRPQKLKKVKGTGNP